MVGVKSKFDVNQKRMQQNEQSQNDDATNSNIASSTTINSDEVDFCSNFGTATSKKVSFKRLVPESLKWPEKWDGWCSWCSHPFDTIPIPCVRKDPLGNPDIVRVSDAIAWFCSPNCMKAYLMWIGTAHSYETLMHMKVILRRVLGIDQEYGAAHPREKLYCFHPGGPKKGLSIHDFRMGHIFKQVFIKIPPLIICSMVTQETDPVPYQNIRTSLAMAVQPQLQRINNRPISNTNATTDQTQSSDYSINHDPCLISTTISTMEQVPSPTPNAPFDSYYAINRMTNGPPPPLTNPSQPKGKRRIPKKNTIPEMIQENQPDDSTMPALESIVDTFDEMQHVHQPPIITDSKQAPKRPKIAKISPLPKLPKTPRSSKPKATKTKSIQT